MSEKKWTILREKMTDSDTKFNDYGTKTVPTGRLRSTN